MLVPLNRTSAPADRFALLIEALCRAVAARARAQRLAGPLLILVWSRLHRMALRFAALAARVRTGRLPARLAARRPSRSGPPPRLLPHGFAWLVRLVPEAAASGSQLQHLLEDPELAALLAAAPQAGRILRPLCRMLGVRPPPGPLTLPRHSRTPLPPRPGASGQPPPPAAPGDRPPAPRRLAPGWLPRGRLPGCLPPFPT